MNYKYKIILFFLIGYSSIYAQEQLTKEQAINIALENNYGIKYAKNAIETAKNNSSILNNNYIPNLTTSASATYSNYNYDYTSQSNVKTEANNAEAKVYSASLDLNYTIFDGLGRSYTYKKLKETHNLSKLEARTVIENTLLQIFTVYYEVAQLTENTKNITESLAISKQRLKRANYGYQYGQNTKLQLLNAEVDVNNDSISYINTQRLLTNSKRDLNMLLGRSISTNFIVDTAVEFQQIFDLQTILEKAKEYNVEMQKINKNIDINSLDIKINKSNLYPTLNFNSAYGLGKNDNDGTYTYAEILSKGLSANVSLSWDIFDGGSNYTKIKNSKIEANNLQIEKEQVLNDLERTLANSLEIYNNSLFVIKAEEKNLETNKRNFFRTEELFKLGQITSIEFRQAQINLLNAQSNLSQAKYNAKNAELKLLQLTGNLLNIKF